jgi:hypothetical protein
MYTLVVPGRIPNTTPPSSTEAGVEFETSHKAPPSWQAVSAPHAQHVTLCNNCHTYLANSTLCIQARARHFSILYNTGCYDTAAD